MPTTKTDLEALDSAIRTSHRVVIGVMLSSLTIYVVWFWGVNSKVLSDQADAWGQFGDFIGGVLNPLVAYAAFYWLTRTVRLQKEELLETRQALAESAEAQAKQASYAQVSVRVSALTALINSIMVEVQTQRMQLQFIVDQSNTHHSGSAKLLDGTMLTGAQLLAYIATLNTQISNRMTERLEFELQLKTLLEQQQ
jgi:hypothetical protein